MAALPFLDKWHSFFFRVFGPKVCLSKANLPLSELREICPSEVKWILEDASSDYGYPGMAIYRLTSFDSGETAIFDGDRKLKPEKVSEPLFQAPCPCAGDGFCYSWARYLIYLRIYFDLERVSIPLSDLPEVARISIIHMEDVFRSFLSALGPDRMVNEALFDRHKIELRESPAGMCLPPRRHRRETA